VTQASTTRRSAGIPDLIAAVLSSNAQTPSFDEVFSTLKEIAEKPAHVTETDGSNLPQVHALNCLRGVFRSSLLSKKAESYLAVNLQLASYSLRSEMLVLHSPNPLDAYLPVQMGDSKLRSPSPQKSH